MDKRDNDLLDLLEKVKQGDEFSFDTLYQRYSPLINAKIAEFSDRLERDEIGQLSIIALYDAAMSYDSEKVDDKVTFGLYADVCIRNKLISELRRVKASEVLDGDIPPSNEGVNFSPEEYILRKEDTLSRIRRAKALLTPFENTVFLLYLSGDSYSDIAKKLGKSRKSVDNALTRIRLKFRSDNMPE